MTQDEYKKKVDELVIKINQAKDRLWRSVSREEYEVSAIMKKQITEDQETLTELLANMESYVTSGKTNSE